MIKNYLKWAEYIQNSENSLLKQLNARLNALRKICQIKSFRARLMVAKDFAKDIYLQMKIAITRPIFTPIHYINGQLFMLGGMNW